MKRNSVLFAALVLMICPLNSLSQNASNQPAKSDLQEYVLIGPVETFRYEWGVFSSKPDKDGKYKERERNYVETATFDINGKLIFRDPPRYRCGMRGLEKRIPTYDEKENLIEELSYDYRGLFSGRTTFKYDAVGNRTEYSYYGRRGLMWVHKFDVKGRQIERASYDGEDTLEFREVFIRNDNGQVIEKLTYNGAGSLKEREISTYEYDDRGNWIKSEDWECNTANDKLPCKPTRIDYRFITFHSEKGGEKTQQDLQSEDKRRNN